MAVKDWAETASDNDDADAASGILWPEGMAGAQVNDSARAMMAVIKSDFAKSHASPGYQKLPNGLIIQFGSSVTAYVTFPIAFPTACIAVTATSARGLGASEAVAVACSSITVAGFALNARYISGGTVTTDTVNGNSWIAIGY